MKALYPTAPAAQSKNDDDRRDPSQDARGGGSGRGGNVAVTDDHSSGWEGLDPLQFVDKITKQAESKMTESQGQLVRTHCVDPALMMTMATVTSSYAEGPASGNKRGRVASTTDPGGSNMPGLAIVPSPAPLPPWDLSFLINSDPDPHLACVAANKLGALAAQIETSPNYFLCPPSYGRLRDELAASCQLIHTEHLNSPATRRSLLDKLYANTVQKMDVLVLMVKHVQPPSGPTILPMSVDEHISSGTGCRQSNSPTKNSGRVFSKRDFSSSMESWIRQNWCNPYPDENGLLEIAEELNTTPTVVSNWLINARTRKWRPAIVKAYDLGRPASTLLEDALNLFQGLPLRELGDDVPYFASPPLGKGGKKGKSKSTGTGKGRKK